VFWFLSGIILIFDGFPHASKEERFLHLETFKSDQLEGLQPPSLSFKGKVMLELNDGKPVYRVFSGRKAQKVYDASTLKEVEPYEGSYASCLAESYNGHPVDLIEKRTDLDQWTPWGYYRSLLPFYKCTMADDKNTVLYISEVSGSIVQETTRPERWSARFGAIPHWIYFKQLRMHRDLWQIVVILLSSLGLLISVTGIYAGIKRLKKSEKLTGITPYKRFWYKWHHLIGFSFGLFVFTFLLSGLISVTNIPDWMAGVDSNKKERIAWKQKLQLDAHFNILPADIYKALKKKEGVRRIEWKTVMDQSQYWVYYDRYLQPEVYMLHNGSIIHKEALKQNQLKDFADTKFPDKRFSIDKQECYDAYYSTSAMYYLPPEVFRIDFQDEQETSIYIDPASGEEIRRQTTNTRLRRWLYRALHTFDFPWLKQVDGVRKVLLIVLSLAGLVISISGFVLSFKWFKRKLKRR
jgi:hypothetical protein